MNRQGKWRLWLLLSALAAVVVAVFCLPRIPQSETYHHFADQRAILRVPNGANVLSNIFFLIVGALGLWALLRDASANGIRFLDPRERWPYAIFFLGVALTAFGSSYYHLAPDDTRLVWDRLPMTVGFLSLVAAMIAERVSVKWGLFLLPFLLLFGAASVVYWSFTQVRGHGDLRAYALAQFGSLLAILFLIALYPPRYTRGHDFIIALGLYALAKIFESADGAVFRLGGITAGHALKHIAAALAALWILRMLRLRTPVPAKPAC